MVLRDVMDGCCSISRWRWLCNEDRVACVKHRVKHVKQHSNREENGLHLGACLQRTCRRVCSIVRISLRGMPRPRSIITLAAALISGWASWGFFAMTRSARR